MSVLSPPHFHDEAKAFEYLESIVWAERHGLPALRRDRRPRLRSVRRA